MATKRIGQRMVNIDRFPLIYRPVRVNVLKGQSLSGSLQLIGLAVIRETRAVHGHVVPGLMTESFTGDRRAGR